MFVKILSYLQLEFDEILQSLYFSPYTCFVAATGGRHCSSGYYETSASY